MADKAIEPGKKSTERYLPKAAWAAMSKAERKKTDDKKKRESRKGKQFVENTKKARLWNSDVDTVKTARCGNCAAFDQTNKIMDFMIKGINETMAADPQDVLDRANLGYCQLFKFKCAATRTCDAWLHGGPITDC